MCGFFWFSISFFYPHWRCVAYIAWVLSWYTINFSPTLFLTKYSLRSLYYAILVEGKTNQLLLHIRIPLHFFAIIFTFAMKKNISKRETSNLSEKNDLEIGDCGYVGSTIDIDVSLVWKTKEEYEKCVIVLRKMCIKCSMYVGNRRVWCVFEVNQVNVLFYIQWYNGKREHCTNNICCCSRFWHFLFSVDTIAFSMENRK